MPLLGAAVEAFCAVTGGAGAAVVDLEAGAGGEISADIDKMEYSPCHIQMIMQ